MNLGADLVRGEQQLVNPQPAVIAGLAAVRAARLLPALSVMASALHTELAHQPLRDDAQERGRQQKGLNAHIEQTRDGRCRIVGVQGGQYQMPGEGGLHCNLRRFQVANLADHDHVRVLPQNRAQGFGKAHVDARIDLSLADAGELIFDRVFDGETIGGGRVEA